MLCFEPPATARWCGKCKLHRWDIARQRFLWRSPKIAAEASLGGGRAAHLRRPQRRLDQSQDRTRRLVEIEPRDRQYAPAHCEELPVSHMVLRPSRSGGVPLVALRLQGQEIGR